MKESWDEMLENLDFDTIASILAYDQIRSQEEAEMEKVKLEVMASVPRL